MSVWKRLFAAVKGGINEAADAAADSQAIRILEQQMREAETELRKSSEALTSIMAKRKLSEQKIADLQHSAAEYESHARKASNSEQSELALDCARKVAELRHQQEQEQQSLAQFQHSEQKLKDNIARARKNFASFQQKLDMVKANAAVQKAQEAVSSHHLGANSKMKTAAEQLERINHQQQQRQAEIDAAEELASDESDATLDNRLHAAGITGSVHSAEEELSRILGKK